ncbi:MAG TPA: NnrU family protein [Ramlibacter sp.]|nr:NnrU family protein [Ramlibacter sp.]
MPTRLTVFAFGVATYLFFGIVVLWSVVFVGDLGFLKTVDSPGYPTPRGQALAIDVALILLFGVQHSVMARGSFKAWLARVVPEPAVRSIYVLASSIALALIYLWWQPVPIAIWNHNDGWPHTVLVALFWTGWAMTLASTFLIDHFDLFGLRQVALFVRGVPYTPVPFKQSWIYKRVRHPLMASFLIAFWATPRMTVGHFVFALGMTIYILVGVWFEERDLVKWHGAAYGDYRKRVPMLVPWRSPKP